ncbi:hypothetical protein HID58_095769 [Brassica napus]|uniref:3-oxoacyl-[acyl-carrier-protein] reductase n=1 Tax=Brassica napus TaxID=3708 RepID=A0ABQ7X2E7_BRANA|nr:hypothetical protein HID58_095769 [Brassica napus]
MEGKKIGRRLEGKGAIVTASTQGIGFGIIERFGLEGASVVVSSRKQANVEEAVEKLKSKGIDAYGIVCHVSNAQHRRNLVEKTVQKYGKIDILVCNAAANPSTDPILSTKEAVLDKLWEINVKSSILLLQDMAPHLEKGLFGYLHYFHRWLSTTRIHGYALAAEMGPDTRVNAVAPGFVPTHFASFITENSQWESIEEKTLLNRLGTTGDMAAAAAFLASDDSSYITGETLVVAGGMPSRL